MQPQGALFDWFGGLWEFYHTVADATQEQFPHARFPSSSIPFASFTFNVGHWIRCLIHRDVLNLAFGICLILVLGNFNHTLGGQIILHEPKLIIEAPPGTSVAIPSGTIRHEVLPLHNPDAERRQSLTGYTSAAIFQFFDSGFKLEGPAPTKKAHVEKRKARGDANWQRGMNMLPTFEELIE
jgi:hypothetical protein